MKMQIISDLHQAFGISDLNFENADLIILAGDTNLGTKGVEWVKRQQWAPMLLFLKIIGLNTG